MSKIVQAANVMIANKENITKVGQRQNELYFLYNEKYKWSMFRNDDPEDYFLFYYQTDLSIEELIIGVSSVEIKSIRYSAREIATKEALSTFRDLFQILKEKNLGIEEVLDDIIDEVPF
jgi:hypothetical protein